MGLRRDQYPLAVMAQACLEVAGDPETGNPDLARRVKEMIDAGGDPFHFLFRAFNSGREIMEKAEEIRIKQANGNGTISRADQR